MTIRNEQLRHMRICVVDHPASEASRIQSDLHQSGYRSVTLTNGLNALMAQLRQAQSTGTSPFDLILISDRLPDANLDEACRILCRDTEPLQFGIILVAEDPETTRQVEKHAEKAPDDIVPSSISASELSRRVKLVLTLHRERQWRRSREEALETELAERKVMEARLKYLVDHDDLTGLPNRRRLDQALELAVIRARNFRRTNALLYLDLDQFKVVNDNSGHDAGDRLLINVASAIRECSSGGYLVARIGADEFAVLMEHVTEPDAMEFAETLRARLSSQRFDIDQTAFQLGVSIGVVVNNPDEEVSASELLSRADQACYLAKSQGRNTVYKFSRDDEQLHALRSDSRWVPAIRDALSDDLFFLVFQPVMDVPGCTVSHYEALLRMRDPDGKVHTPAQFIPTAERMGLIHSVDLWVVEHILDFLASLPSHQSDISMSINLSGHAFQDPALLPLIKKKLEMNWLAASRVMFEITETAAVTNYSETRKMVARLRALGCRFALDDFGSGFSSFSYIKNFPVDMLKIDGSFVANLIDDPTDQLLVKSMVDVAHSLGKKVVAEYVENANTLDMLTEFGVDYVQGHYVGQPEVHLVPKKWHRDTGREPANAARPLGGDEMEDMMSSIFQPIGYDDAGTDRDERS